MDRPQRAIMAAAGVIGLIALVRLSTVQLLLATSIVGTVALLLTVIGLSLNMRAHGAEWNRGWVALSAGLALDVSHTLGRPALGTSSGAAELVGATAGLVTIVGLGLLVEHRERGRAVEFGFEGLIVALTVGFAAWLHLAPQTAGVGVAPALAALAPAALDLIALWMVARLVSMSPGYPAAYRLLAASLAVMFAVDAVGAGAAMSAAQVTGIGLGALQFSGFVLWAMATAHPSLSDTFEPVPALETRLSVPQVLLLGAAMLAGPVTLVTRWISGAPRTDAVAVVIGTMLITTVVVAHLLRLLQLRATTEYRAQHDALTGLPNRILFQDRLDVAITTARRTGGNVGVFFLDLDRFKTVNDSLGHDAGNRLLQEVSRRLRAVLREQDTVARLGGDEFSLLVADVDGEHAAVTVARKILRAFEGPFELGDASSLRVSTSIGIATFPDHGGDPDELLKNADTAMYRAKDRGRGTYQVYTTEMSARARVKLSLESALHGAIDRGELALHYQPQVDQHDGSVIGLEALVRWEHPKLGSISPAAFVTLAEESGLILEMGRWVLETACRQAQAWRTAGVIDVPVGVNVSGRQFASGQLQELVTRVLAETGLPPDRLEIELTESIFHRDIEATSKLLTELRDLGVRTSIDDFGTGYSGLSYLARLPIDRLKIDRSFVQLVEEPGADASLVGAIVALARSLDMEVIAEGVETAGQARFLLDIGCRAAQGFKYSRPLSPVGVERRLVHDPATGAVRIAARPPVQRTTDPDLIAVELDRRRLASVLAAVCANADDLTDLDALDVVLAELDTTSRPGSWLPSPVMARVVAGTAAGLLPIVGGAAAAGALPGPVQEVASEMLRGTGLTAAAAASEDPALDVVSRAPRNDVPGPDVPGPDAPGPDGVPGETPLAAGGLEVAGQWLTSVAQLVPRAASSLEPIVAPTGSDAAGTPQPADEALDTAPGLPLPEVPEAVEELPTPPVASTGTPTDEDPDDERPQHEDRGPARPPADAPSETATDRVPPMDPPTPAAGPNEAAERSERARSAGAPAPQARAEAADDARHEDDAQPAPPAPERDEHAHAPARPADLRGLVGATLEPGRPAGR